MNIAGRVKDSICLEILGMSHLNHTFHSTGMDYREVGANQNDSLGTTLVRKFPWATV